MKLVRYISQRYLLYVFILLLISIPVFYFSLRQILLHNLDESLYQQKDWVVAQIAKNPVVQMESFNNSISFIPSIESNHKDSIFNQDILIPQDNEIVMHRVLIAYETIGDKMYKIRLQKSTIEDDDLLQSILYLLVSLLILLGVGLVLINLFVSKKVWLPFYEILGRLKNYQPDKQEEWQVPETRIAEFKQLATSLRDLTSRNDQMFKAQKEFTENASHELQTPLAILQGKIELLMQTDPISEEQASHIESMSEAGNRLQYINRALLLLTRIDNRQFGDKKQVSVTAVLDKIIPFYSDLAREKSIDIQKEVLPDRIVEAYQGLMEILLGNLLSNAVRHTPDNGVIQVRLEFDAFTVINAPANGMLDVDQIFRRFKKQSTHKESLGLGLEICKRICDLNGFYLDYFFIHNTHRFVVKFNQQ